MKRFYTLYFSVFTELEQEFIYSVTSKKVKTGFNKQFFYILSKIKMKPGKEVINKIINYAGS